MIFLQQKNYFKEYFMKKRFLLSLSLSRLRYHRSTLKTTAFLWARAIKSAKRCKWSKTPVN
ncbi:hypothetical protein FIM63_01795 [Helicobacter pylori]|nr:hypothetical protein FIM63_01795 [Helicobacter pylori]